MTKNDKWINKGTELIDKYFPKGECQERGEALCLFAFLTIEHEKMIEKLKKEKNGNKKN
jgi:hypothetical protein